MNTPYSVFKNNSVKLNFQHYFKQAYQYRIESSYKKNKLKN
jgi:hypothetical protein